MKRTAEVTAFNWVLSHQELPDAFLGDLRRIGILK